MPMCRSWCWGPTTGRCPSSASAALPGDSDQIWRYAFNAGGGGVYDVRFVGDGGARLLAQQLLRVCRRRRWRRRRRRTPWRSAGGLPARLRPAAAHGRRLVAGGRRPRRVRPPLHRSASPPTMPAWATSPVATCWPSIPTIGPSRLTAAWFQRHYPGTRFTPVVADCPGRSGELAAKMGRDAVARALKGRGAPSAPGAAQRSASVCVGNYVRLLRKLHGVNTH